MLIKGATQHDNVVDVDEAVRPLETGQDKVHQLWNVVGVLH